jgi:hypothetical protein
MFQFNISVRLPNHWFPKISFPGWYTHGSFKYWTHKAWELQLGMFNPGTLFDLDVDARMSGHDHAGICFELTFFGIFFNAQIHDIRHWNYQENRWYTDEEARTDAEEWVHERSMTLDQVRGKIFDALGTSTIVGSSDRLILQNGEISYDGDFSLDRFVESVFVEEPETRKRMS